MSPRGRLIAGASLVTALSLPIAALALPGDPFRSVELTPDQAVANVAAFVDSPDLVATSLIAVGPVDGAFARAYQVTGPRISATVDVRSGQIITFYLGSATGSGDATINADTAKTTAEAFLLDRSISVASLDESVRFANHGESSEYVVEWQRYANGAIAPDYRTIGVDASTGEVFRYSSVQRPFDPPLNPKLDRSAAINAALEFLRLSDQAQVDKTELRIVFTPAGVQRLVWDVYLTEVVDTTVSGQSIPAHWTIEVDADSGATSLLTTG